MNTIRKRNSPKDRPSENCRGAVSAVLGPTNTGKTYLAVDRMLDYASGMIGFPLRLLARENYDRVVSRVGAKKVALITGEEKILPAGAVYFLCTVESMPENMTVEFLAVDEIQLAGDRERGHVFTSRLLHARGTQETMFMGSEIIAPLIRRLIPDARFISRPRFSELRYSGVKKITRLPRRSAVVAFSANDVYALAERLRRFQGGAAVVLGALSPRARNAQVAMFQSGEVDYLVATDAIGMGLNMDLAHVAFAQTKKFDGVRNRPLDAAEMGQVAGRAGRHMSNGTFGTTNGIGPLDEEIITRLETHDFPRLKGLYWRNEELDFSSPRDLLASLDKPASDPVLLRGGGAQDQLALSILAKDATVQDLAAKEPALRLLWDICRIPDYRKILSDDHARLLTKIFRHLMTGPGVLPEDWVARQVDRLERTDGGIDALSTRIAHIRTWSYVAHRGDWLADSSYWQGRCRKVEDRLSDALHESLTQRFVDERAAVLASRLAEGDDLLAGVQDDGTVVVEGHFVGHLEGFRFIPDQNATSESVRALMNAARRALRGEISRRVQLLCDDREKSFAMDETGHLSWRGVRVARLVKGPDLLTPKIEVLPSELLDPVGREQVTRRLTAWLDTHLAQRFAPLLAAERAKLSGAARGIIFQLREGLGSVPRKACADQVRALTSSDRKKLANLGIRLGREYVYFQALLKARVCLLRAVLFLAGCSNPPDIQDEFNEALSFLKAGRISVPITKNAATLYKAGGFWCLPGAQGSGRALRVDRLERLLEEIWKLMRQGPFLVTPRLSSLAACGERDLVIVLGALGFRTAIESGGITVHPKKLSPRKNVGKKSQTKAPRNRKTGDSPFAVLAALKKKP